MMLYLSAFDSDFKVFFEPHQLLSVFSQENKKKIN